MRLACLLIGHDPFDIPGGECCQHCGDKYELYEDQEWSDWQRYGIVWPLRLLWWRLKRVAWPRCDTCGKRIYGRGVRSSCGFRYCNDTCETNWIPF